MSNSFCDQPVSVKPIDRTEVLGPINIFIKATTQSHEILARTMSSIAYLLFLTFKRTLVAIFLMFFSCFEGHSVNIFLCTYFKTSHNVHLCTVLQFSWHTLIKPCQHITFTAKLLTVEVLSGRCYCIQKFHIYIYIFLDYVIFCKQFT